MLERRGACADVEPIASLDRITVVGDVEGCFMEDGRPSGVGLVEALAVCRSYAETTSPGKYPYGSAFSIAGGGYVSFARRGATVPLVRVDMNPNTLVVDAPVRAVVGLLFDSRCTRLDVAVDYPDFEIGDWLPSGRNGKRFEVASRSGNVETMMVGARSSARQLVVYDKVADAQAKKVRVPWGHVGSMMRVEARERYRPTDGKGVLAPDLLDDVTLCSRRSGSWFSLPVRSRALVEYMVAHPECRSELSPYYRKKLDALILVQGDSDAQLHPSRVYRSSLAVLRESYLDAICGGGGGVVDTVCF